MMDRRVFLTTVAGLLAAPLPAEAQQTGQVYPVGFISGGTKGDQGGARLFAAFEEGLRDRGWVEGQNLIIETRFAGGVEGRMPAMMAELISLGVDVIVTTSTIQAQVARRATTEIPIVFQMVSDPVASGLVASLARPGGTRQGGPIFCRRRAARCSNWRRRSSPARPGSPSWPIRAIKERFWRSGP